MKIAFISTLDVAKWGGCEALWFEAARLALEQKHQVFTSTYYWQKKPDTMAELSRLGAQTFFWKGRNPSIVIRLYTRLKSKLVKETPEVKALKKFNPDVIVVSQQGAYNITYKPNLIAFLLASPKPYYIMCHSYDEGMVLPEAKREAILSVFGKAKKVFMISKYQKAVISKQLVHNLANTQIVANPLNLKSTTPLAFPPIDTIQLASVASLNADMKGQDIVLEVLSSIKWKQRNWQLNLFGEGPDRKYFEELIGYYGLEGRVILHGHVKDINAVWAQNHILLLSSRKESGPMALTEAMLCGRPVVATLVGLVHEMVQDGYNGFVAGAATVKLFDEALERAWLNKEQWPIMGERAHQTALAAIDAQAPATFLDILINTQ